MRSTPLFLSFMLLCCSLLAGCAPRFESMFQPTQSDGNRHLLRESQLVGGRYHTRHRELFGQRVSGFNLAVLEAIDKIQGSVEEGGGYFSNINATPPASPVGFPINLFQNRLYTPTRETSFDVGATYAAFIETLNRLYASELSFLDRTRVAAMRVTDPEGNLRLPGDGFFGHWATRDFGMQLALVQYARMGVDIPEVEARPGDFVNIQWRDGGSTSAVFLGWHIDRTTQRRIVYWTSSNLTDGFGDVSAPVSWVRAVRFVRLTEPDALFSFDPRRPVDGRVRPQRIEW